MYNRYNINQTRKRKNGWLSSSGRGGCGTLSKDFNYNWFHSQNRAESVLLCISQKSWSFECLIKENTGTVIVLSTGDSTLNTLQFNPHSGKYEKDNEMIEDSDKKGDDEHWRKRSISK